MHLQSKKHVDKSNDTSSVPGDITDSTGNDNHLSHHHEPHIQNNEAPLILIYKKLLF